MMQKKTKMRTSKIEINNLSRRLYLCYSKDICYPKIRDNWNEKNKYFGMCAITSLIVNDYFGGEICKVYVDKISHYFNLLNDEIIDLTAKQFETGVNYSNYEILQRNDVLTEDTKKRYDLLKKRLEDVE